MGIEEKLGMSGQNISIDWELTPSDTFAMFESWGGKERLRHNNEMYYYFYIDNWAQPARLTLMERGVKHAKRLARINCPQAMVDGCVTSQGKGKLDNNYAINDGIKQWLKNQIFDGGDYSLVEPVVDTEELEALDTDLPTRPEAVTEELQIQFRSIGAVLNEQEVPELIKQFGFYDSQHNPDGSFANFLLDNDDGLTVSDQRTGLMWQRGGCDITTIRNIQKYIDAINGATFAGYTDWRLPTMEEASSLLERQRNEKGLHLHPCFSKEQPFIFLADQRKPGGYWFIDFKQATIFWASGTIPGAFGRLVRSL